MYKLFVLVSAAEFVELYIIWITGILIKKKSRHFQFQFSGNCILNFFVSVSTLNFHLGVSRICIYKEVVFVWKRETEWTKTHKCLFINRSTSIILSRCILYLWVLDWVNYTAATHLSRAFRVAFKMLRWRGHKIST